MNLFQRVMFVLTGKLIGQDKATVDLEKERVEGLQQELKKANETIDSVVNMLSKSDKIHNDKIVNRDLPTEDYTRIVLTRLCDKINANKTKSNKKLVKVKVKPKKKSKTLKRIDRAKKLVIVEDLKNGKAFTLELGEARRRYKLDFRDNRDLDAFPFIRIRNSGKYIFRLVDLAKSNITFWQLKKIPFFVSNCNYKDAIKILDNKALDRCILASPLFVVKIKEVFSVCNEGKKFDLKRFLTYINQLKKENLIKPLV